MGSYDGAETSTQLRKVYFLTNPTNTNSQPNINSSNDWKICSYSETSLGDDYIRSCDRDPLYTLTRQFSIFSTAYTLIQLRQVEVYGHEISQLSGDIDVQLSEVTANSITISFQQWNQSMIGGLPPTEYRVVSSGNNSTQTVQHDPASPRLTVEFTKLETGNLYTFTISCLVQGVKCPGDSYPAIIFTECDVPDLPGPITFTSEKFQHDGRQRWKYTASWEASTNVNCGGVLKYRYKLKERNTSDQQEETTTVFYIDGSEEFEFMVKAENSQKSSEFRRKTETSGVLNPQFKSYQPSLTVVNTSCVSLTWIEPQYPGGSINLYQFRCDSGNWSNVTTSKSVKICEYQPYTSTQCEVRAWNSAGSGTSNSISATTQCAEPVFSKPPTFEEGYDGAKRRRQVIVTVEEVAPQCASLNPLEYKLTGRGYSTNMIIRDLNALTLYNITIRASNNEGLRSTKYITVKTGELDSYSANKSCVVAEWEEPVQPNGVIIMYEYQCVREEKEYPQWTSTTEQVLEDCGYEPGSIVKCKVRAWTAIGTGPAYEFFVNIKCDNPSTPSFLLNSTKVSSEETTIIISLEESMHKCRSIENYTILIHDPEGQMLYSDTNATAGYITVEGALPFTRYSVLIETINDADLRSQTKMYLTTAETKTPEEPKAMILSNTSCITVSLEKPNIPNGVIESYEVSCSYPEQTEILLTMKADANESAKAEFCAIPSATLVECCSSATNSIGKGNETQNRIYTQLKPVDCRCDQRIYRLHEENNIIGEKQKGCRPEYMGTKDYLMLDKVILTDLRHWERWDTGEDLEIAQGEHEQVEYNLIQTHTCEYGVTREDSEDFYPRHMNKVRNTKMGDTGYEKRSKGGKGLKNGVETIQTEEYGLSDYVKCKDNGLNKYLKSFEKEQLKHEYKDTKAVLAMVRGFSFLKNSLFRGKAQPLHLKRSSDAGAAKENPHGELQFLNRSPTPFYVGGKRSSGRVTRNVADCGCTKESINQRYIDGRECYCYTTAELTAENVGEELIFNIGDGKTYGGFANVELEAQAQYNVYIAVTEGFDPLIEIHPSFITIVASKQGSGDGVIAGAVVGGIVLAALVLLIIFLICRRLRNQPIEKEDPLELSNEPAASVSASASDPPAVCVREPQENYQNLDEVHRSSISESIPVQQLEWYTRSNKAVIREQYQKLKDIPAPEMDVAKQAKNKGKCRYLKLYPADDHRVKLREVTEGQTDFINASFLKGYGRDNQYIAAQGPFTDETVRDFWQMIWEQKPAAIVMVTNTIENTKVKCMQYWPLEQGVVQNFGSFKVSLKSTDMFSEFAMNRLEVTQNGETRRILHFYYLSWPDHGVPDIELFVSFHRLINASIHHGKTQPLLVHCSAGVGRTGTYVALDYLLDQAEAEGVVNVFECLKEMRSRRPCMIQTVDQYELLHDALSEALATQNFPFQPTEIETKISMHKLQPNSEADLISVEYQHTITRAASLDHSYATAKDAKNRHKNRFSEILPAESAMLYLLNGANGNYINAVTVDGYKQKKQWIATQLPLSNTIPDFWQLILENDISVIFQLDTSPTLFYPNKDSMVLEVEPFLITRKITVIEGTVKVIHLQLETEKV
ncbi:receptor-type tyrosine-protein phosphatase delta-like [Watersipora subatra]|uniref:receptor-type tyrosine-protein phosphatase delta-like n=1 Tax=Watersipora subatra TaxID=2589382 RepID=UPI00355AE63F